MKPSFRQVIGAFRILARRSREVGRPGLATWAMAGAAGAESAAVAVRDSSHRAESGALSLAKELDAMLADGEICVDEMRRLQLAPARARRIADHAHDAGEVVS